MENMCSSVPVHPQERQLCQHRDWSRLGCEAAQERVDPPTLPKVDPEGGPIGAG